MTNEDTAQARPNSDLRNMTPSPALEAAFVVPGRPVLLLRLPKNVYERATTRHNDHHLRGRKQCVKP
ncbi:hypothetical protein JQ616_19600 [Bradyrhizobium tropiciagri]|uniref:hypothetical protein n=1 Tax=Bradyrhizobium tropiciagri TaxID=312253 RepID=UPI001BADA80C|nr:hypothetical protein [Bradyrhizobium tropiciagri]MBR0897165.1 hypothetical protein [Bradyrhizobium tropiciagri]